MITTDADLLPLKQKPSRSHGAAHFNTNMDAVTHKHACAFFVHVCACVCACKHGGGGKAGAAKNGSVMNMHVSSWFSSSIAIAAFCHDRVHA